MLDLAGVDYWITLCVGLVDFVLGRTVLASFLLLHVYDDLQGFDLVQVLRVLGLHPQMLFYGSKPLYPHTQASPQSILGSDDW